MPRPQNADWFPRPLTEGQYQRLEQVVLAQTGRMSPLEAALHSSWFFILGDGGLRISELEALTISDWDAPTRSLHIRYGKGGRERRIPLSVRAARALAAHLGSRPEATLARHKPLVFNDNYNYPSFTFLAERYERRSVVITSNLVFSQWDQIFKDPLTTAAAIDRVVHHSRVIEFGSDVASVRAEQAAQRRQRELAQDTPEPPETQHPEPTR